LIDWLRADQIRERVAIRFHEILGSDTLELDGNQDDDSDQSLSHQIEHGTVLFETTDDQQWHN
jgi:hypothetical protein